MQSESNLNKTPRDETFPVVMVEPGNVKIADLYLDAALEMGLDLHFLTDDSSIGSKYPSRTMALIMGSRLEVKFETIRKKLGRVFHVFTESEIHLSLTRALQMHPDYSGFWTPIQLIPRSKQEMKKIFAEHDIPHARGFYLPADKGEIPDLPALGLQFPVVVKPEAGMSSCGVRKCHSESDLVQAIRNVRVFNQVVLRHHDSSGLGTLIEEFIDGPEYAVDTCWQDGLAVKHFILCRGPMDSDTFPDDLYYDDPLLPPALSLALTKASESCGTALQMHSGVTHTEMRLTKDGKLRVIETTPRAGAGGMFYLLHSYRLGFNSARYSLQRFSLQRFSLQRFSLQRCFHPNNVEEISPSSRPEFNQSLAKSFLAFYQPIVPTKGKLSGIKGIEKVTKEPYYLDSVRFVSDGTRWSGSDMNLRYSIWFLISTESESAMRAAIEHINLNVQMIWDNR